MQDALLVIMALEITEICFLFHVAFVVVSLLLLMLPLLLLLLLFLVLLLMSHSFLPPFLFPQWGTANANAEIKVPSVENTELKRSPFKAWSRYLYIHTYYAYCQGSLPCFFLSFRSIHLHFIPKLLSILPLLAVANSWFLCRPAE